MRRFPSPAIWLSVFALLFAAGPLLARKNQSAKIKVAAIQVEIQSDEIKLPQCRHEGEVQHGLEILLCDRGPEVDASKLKGLPLEEIRPGGLGMHLIQQAMDTVEFTRKGPTNRLRLVKYLAPASNAS